MNVQVGKEVDKQLTCATRLDVSSARGRLLSLTKKRRNTSPLLVGYLHFYPPVS